MPPRRRRPRGHIEKLPSGSFRARVYAGLDPLTLRRRYILETAPTYEAAAKAATRLQGQVDEDKHPKANISVRQAIEQWLEVVVLEDTTRERYEDLIRLYVMPTFGTLPAARLDAELLERFYARLHRCREMCTGQARNGHTCRPLSSSTTRKIHYIIRGALGRAVRWQHLGVNKAAMAVAPSPERTEPDPPNADEAARLLNAAWAEPEWGLLLWLTMLTGPRRGEISALRWRHVDFDRGLLTILDGHDARQAGAGPCPGRRAREARRLTRPIAGGSAVNYGLAIPALADGGDEEPPTLDDVERAVSEIFDAYQASRYGYVTGRAPLVLSDALRASQAVGADQANRANAFLALAYQSAVSVLTKLGETDLAWVASERGLHAAQAADNPVVLGSLFRCVAHAVHSTGRFQAGVQLVQAAANVLEPHVGRRAEDALISVYDTLFLTGAVAAARADDRASATAFLAEAADCAGRLGRDANSMWTAFGPTNVAIHRMTAAMELGDVQIAVDLAPRIDASAMPTERRVRHAIETARAYTARNRRDDALGVLLDAEQLAPEQIRHHAISRQLVLSWLRNNRGARSVALEQLAGRLRLA